jgi:hypothetical protein
MVVTYIHQVSTGSITSGLMLLERGHLQFLSNFTQGTVYKKLKNCYAFLLKNSVKIETDGVNNR